MGVEGVLGVDITTQCYTPFSQLAYIEFFLKEHSNLKKSEYLHINKTYVHKIETHP